MATVLFAAVVWLVVRSVIEDMNPRPVSEREAIGTYTFRWVNDVGRYVGTEILILRPDHNYMQIFGDGHGHTLRDRGEWRLTWHSTQYIELESDHQWVREATGPRMVPGHMLWMLHIEKLRSGGVEISINESRLWRFAKPPP